VRFGERFKNIVFLPRILAPTAVAVLWYYVYAPHGLLNRVVGFFTGRSIDVG
jgi:ABC-type sugar transport system permease subunit